MADVKDTFQLICQGNPKPDEIPDTTFQICWYRERLGSATITDDGLKWNGFASEKMEKLFGAILPTREEDGMPQFLVNLEPEHEVFSKMGISEKGDYLSTGLRFLSNLTVSRNAPFDLPVNDDKLRGTLTDFTDDKRVFTGSYLSESPSSYDEDELYQDLTDMWTNRYAPRYSGQENKIPVTLHPDGTMENAICTPFTHFLKLPTDGLKEGWGVNEWMCMELAEASGLETAKHALIDLGNGLAPAYVVERFDIEPENQPSTTRTILQDFCTLDGMRPLKGLQATKKEGLAAGTTEKVAKVLAEYSTDPQKDLENLLRRTLVSYAVGDCDMHRKNISMLITCDTETGDVISANMSPAYDITSEIHETESQLGLTLPINGKAHKLKKQDIIACAQKMGIESERAEQIMEDTFTKIAYRAVEIAQDLPEQVDENVMAKYTAHRIATIAVNRAKGFGYDAPAWEDTPLVKIDTRRQNPEFPMPVNTAAFRVC